VGEAFSSAGLAIAAAYSDGTGGPVASGWTLSWNNAALAEGSTAVTAAAGAKTVAVTYQGRTASFDIVVGAAGAVFAGVSVSAPPAKTVYTVGEAFSSAGLAITAAYSDGTDSALDSGWTLTWNGAALAGGSTAITAAAGTKTVTVSYQGKTAAFTIAVSAPERVLAGISIGAQPTKTAYTVGEAFSSAGLAITAAYSDGSSAPLASGWTLTWNGVTVTEGSALITAAVGTRAITVSYQGKTATFSITVTDPVRHTVAFDTNGGSTIPSQSIATGGKATRPADPGKAGYTFASWHSDSGLAAAYDFNAPVVAALTLYAKWTISPTLQEIALSIDDFAGPAGLDDPGDSTVISDTAFTLAKPSGTQLISVSGSYNDANAEWYIGLAKLHTGSSKTLSAANLSLGGHVLTVFAVYGGKRYSKELSFTVTE
jgi:uncharacterized repeat protein (TIGR02543 family)